MTNEPKPKPINPLAGLLRGVAAILDSPEEWDQSDWRCGTTMCLAGHVIAEAGGRLAHPDNPESDFIATDEALLGRLGIDWDEPGERTIGGLAEEFLSDLRPGFLFSGNNGLEEILRYTANRMAKEWMGEVTRAMHTLLVLADPGSGASQEDRREGVREAKMHLAAAVTGIDGSTTMLPYDDDLYWAVKSINRAARHARERAASDEAGKAGE